MTNAAEWSVATSESRAQLGETSLTRLSQGKPLNLVSLPYSNSKDWTEGENDMLLGLASGGTSAVSVGVRGFGDGKSPSESRGVLRDRRLGISHRWMAKVPLAAHTIDGQA